MRCPLVRSHLARVIVGMAPVLLLLQVPPQLYAQALTLRISAVDSATSAPVPFAILYVDEACVGQLDSLGTIMLTLAQPPPCVTVKATAIGYAAASTRVCFEPSEPALSVVLRLLPQPVQMRGVTVEARRLPFSTIGPAKYASRARSLELAPLWPGDPARFIQMLPAVSFGSDFSSSFYAAGSDFYQSAVLWNGTPGLNCSHLGGLFSSLVALPGDSVVATVLAPAANAPLFVGGTLEIWSRPHPYLEVDLNPLSAMVGYGAVWGPIAVSAHGRFVHFATIGSAAGVRLPYNFGDGAAWGRLHLSRRVTAEGSVLASGDVLTVETGRWSQHKAVQWEVLWGNTLARAALNYRLSGSAAARLIASRSAFRMAGAGPEDNVSSSISIEDVEQSFSFPLLGTSWKASVGKRHYHTVHEWRLLSRELWDIVGNPANFLFDFAPPRFSAAQEVSVLVPTWQLDAAYRQLKATFSARILLLLPKWRQPLTSGVATLSWKSSLLEVGLLGGRNVQLHYARKQVFSEEVLEPASAFFLCTDPRQALTVSYAGGTCGGSWHSLWFSAHVYTKLLHNVPITDLARRREVMGSGRAHGAGLSFGVSSNRFCVSFAADLARAYVRHQTWYPAHYDRPIQAKLLAEWDPWPRLTVSAFGVACSGLPYTEIDLKFRSLGDLYDLSALEYEDLISVSGPDEDATWRGAWTALFAARTPAYLRLDLTLQYAFRRSAQREWVVYLKVFNATDEENPLAYVWDMEMRSPRRKPIRGLVRLPMLGLRYCASRRKY